MSFNASVLNDWKDVENSITQKAIVQNKIGSLPNLHIVPNVVGSVEVPFIYSSPSFSNSVCNSTTSGTTSLGTTAVATCFLSMHDELCEQDLQGKTFSKFLNGKLSEELPFEEAIAEEAAAQIAAFTQKQWMQGHPSVAVDNVLCTGLYYVLSAGTASTVNVTATAITKANAVTVLDTYLSNIPDGARDMEYIAVLLTPAAFQAIKLGYRDANLSAYSQQDDNNMVFKVPGYNNIYVHGIAGASGNQVVITYSENLIYAYNINSPLELYYDKSKRKYAKHADFRIGANVHFLDHVVFVK